ncbi:MAG TPA: SDR family NAD(P)-dependent oxidoreductase [Candidatus Dormibacteraeota bacterium]
MVVLVTGAASGLGAAMLRRLRAAGHQVAGLDLAPATGADLPLLADVTSDHDVDAALAEIGSRFGRLDGLASCAGIATRDWVVSHRQPWSEWSRMLDVNLSGTFRVVRAALPMLVESRGAIVLVASVLGTQPMPGGTPYAVSKAGILALMRGLAIEYAPRGVRVNAVSPGFMDTPMGARNLSDPDFRRSMEAGIPLGRISDPDDVASAMEFLLSPAARDVTGRELVVDGGRSLTTFALPELESRIWEEVHAAD